MCTKLAYPFLGEARSQSFIARDGHTQALRKMFQLRDGEYLTSLGGREYCDHLFAYIERAKRTPRSLIEQLNLLRAAGIAELEVHHKNGPLGFFGGLKQCSLPRR